MIPIKIYWPREATLIWQRLGSKWVKMTHWAGMKWQRGWDKIRVKASTVGNCNNEIALALWTFFIFLPLPSSPITCGELYIFIHFDDAWPSADCQQICTSKKHCCYDYHFLKYLLLLWIVILISSLKFRMSILNCFIPQGHSSTQSKVIKVAKFPWNCCFNRVAEINKLCKNHFNKNPLLRKSIYAWLVLPQHTVITVGWAI